MHGCVPDALVKCAKHFFGYCPWLRPVTSALKGRRHNATAHCAKGGLGQGKWPPFRIPLMV